MPRKSRTQITTQHANAIITKLGIKLVSGRKHDIAQVYAEGHRIGQFGLRRGSRPGEGHDYVPKALKVSASQCRSLAECSLSAAAWIEILREKKVIPNPCTE